MFSQKRILYKLKGTKLYNSLRLSTSATLLDETLTGQNQTATNTNQTPVTTATIPYMYIKGTSEAIARILQPGLRHPCCLQTHHYFTTTIDEH